MLLPEDNGYNAIENDLDALVGGDEPGVNVPVLGALVEPSVPSFIPGVYPYSGAYVMEETALPEDLQALLHGRAYVVDRDAISEGSSSQSHQFYIAADTGKGLIVPARALAIENAGSGLMHYRWTDDGIKWTEWATLDEGETHSYGKEELCRFAEIQVYVDTPVSYVSVRATR